MNCDQAKELIHAYADGELDLVKTLDVENHMRDCIDCTAARRGILLVRSKINDESLYFRAPNGLESRIRSHARRERSSLSSRNIFVWKWAGAAAVIALLAGVVWTVLRGSENGVEKQLASEVASAHVRSLMAEHLWDVKSTDQHTVKPWFDGKLDFAPEVRDFKADSFALEGGRLDYLAGRPVAALVYRHEKHYLNLFVWPAPGRADRSESITTRQGYVLAQWTQAGMNCWAVSDMSEEGLRRFVKLVRTPANRP